jgi:hypothetical protein
LVLLICDHIAVTGICYSVIRHVSSWIMMLGYCQGWFCQFSIVDYIIWLPYFSLDYYYFLTSALYGGRLSASRTGQLYPQGHPWYSFSRVSESTPGPWFSRKKICHWKILWHDRESIPGPSN